MSKTLNPHIRLIAAVLTLAIWSATAAADIIYVDPNAPGIYVDPNAPAPVHNGNSWPKAYNYLQDALSDAESGDQIRVANGTYRPDQDAAHPNGSNSTSATFALEDGVEIYGGYAGYGAPDPNARDTDVYKSILTGVLSTRNSLHVVTGSGTDATAVLDGFTITGGNAASSSGGGMFNYNPPGSPTVVKCLFKGNSTAYRGGGMYNWSGSAPTLIDCSFENNSADLDGGGLYNTSASPTISNCTFTSNSASRYGGGLCNDDSNPVVTNCTFSNNTAGERGGGTYNWSTTEDLEFVNCTYTGNLAAELGGGMCNWNGTAKLFDCLFSGNSATLDGAAMYNKADDPMVINCTFAANVATGNAGGIFNELANPTIANCILWANTDSSGSPELAQIQGGFPQVTYSCIQDDDPDDSYVPFQCPDCNNIDDDPMFVREPNAGGDGWGDDPCTPGMDEGANDDYGDLHLLPGSPCIDAANNTMVPADAHDLDDDLDTTELTPLDLDYNLRFIDDPTTTNTGIPDSSHDPNVIVDIGAYEYEYVPGGPKYCGGTGTAEDPYLICDPNYMQEIGANPEDWDKDFKLIADIDLGRYTGTQFNIIGDWGDPFTGVFDGDGHTISNFNYDTSGATGLELDGIGIFKHIKGEGDTAVIENVGLIDPNVISENGDYIGSLIGMVGQGSTLINNCYVNGTNVSGNEKVGGLIGAIDYYWTATVSNCSSVGEVKGNNSVGGLVGYHYLGTISKCWATCNVKGDNKVGGLVGYGLEGDIIKSWSSGTVVGDDRVGGLAGTSIEFYSIPTVSNCYSIANVNGNNKVGGLIGINSGNVYNCFSAGRIVGTSSVGGLIGDESSNEILACFWDSDINPELSGIGNTSDPNVIGETTINMQTQSTFTNTGWDFVDETANGTEDIWKICDGAAYPRLWWEARALDGDTNNDCRVDLVDLAIVSYQWLDAPGEPSADIAPAGGDGEVNSDDLLVVAQNWLAGTQEAVIPGDLTLDLTLDETWMYQNLEGSINSNLTATASVIDDPTGNSTYTYIWEFDLPDDVTVGPSTISGGGPGDVSWNFAAPNVNQPEGLSDSGQAITVRVTVTGDQHDNSGQAEAQFGIALLGDVNNDRVVNIADRSIINAFWRTGSAGNFTLRDCDINSNDTVNIADRSIANAVWRGQLGQNSVSQPCPFR